MRSRLSSTLTGEPRNDRRQLRQARARVAEGRGACRSRLAEASTQRGVFDQLAQRRRELVRIVRRHTEPARRIDDLGRAAEFRGHDRQTGGQGLDKNDPEGLGAEVRLAIDVGGAQQFGDIRALAAKPDAIGDAELFARALSTARCCASRRCCAPPTIQQTHRGARQPAQRRKMDHMAFPGLDAAGLHDQSRPREWRNDGVMRSAEPDRAARPSTRPDSATTHAGLADKAAAASPPCSRCCTAPDPVACAAPSFQPVPPRRNVAHPEDLRTAAGPHGSREKRLRPRHIGHRRVVTTLAEQIAQPPSCAQNR